jgi:hypothetical protein
MIRSLFITGTKITKNSYSIETKLGFWGFSFLVWGFGLGGKRHSYTFVTESLTSKPFCLMFDFFVEGGLGFMSVLTVLLVAIFFAAWKAPRWVKEIGLFALLFGFLGTILGLWQVLNTLADASTVQGELSNFSDKIPQGVLCVGLRLTLNTAIYGICIYLVSLVVRVIQKPRL